MKIRVKELTVSDKRKGIKVGDVFEVVESNYGGYYVELENGFIKKVLGNKRYWFLGEENVIVISGLNTPLYYTPKFKSRNYVTFLPRKVIFNEAKGKTTLLFGEKPYDVVTSIASHGDKFDKFIGFATALLKAFDNKTYLCYTGLSDLYLGGALATELEDGMSVSQIRKLLRWRVDKPITFNINGIEHTIDVEFKTKENKKNE